MLEEVQDKDGAVTLQIIGAGFGRTGTWSTQAALNRLGFPCYHMQEVLLNKANRRHLDFWRRVANSAAGSSHDWNSVLGNYAATLDNPACCVWQELMSAFPEAKVILTLHPKGPEAWYSSTIETIYFSETLWQFKVLEWLTPVGRKQGDMFHKLVWGRTLKGVMTYPASAIARYNSHIEDVKSRVPSEKLLVFKVTDGWEPLCRFLGVEVPSEPFPTLNDRQSVLKAIEGIKLAAYGVIFAYSLAAFLAILGIWTALGA